MNEKKLAIFGGSKAIRTEPGDIFDWPIVTAEDEAAVLDVLRRRAMSGSDVTLAFEKEFAEWQGVRHALGFNNGTAAIQAAMYACGVRVGDEIICQSLTYWASCLSVFSLGGTVVFADVEPHSLCLDPRDVERRLTDRTKAIVVVHYLGYPTDMDPIMAIARKRGIKVIEDVSHAHGGVYKGRKLGSIGDVAAMSFMTGKSLVAGEAGMLVTNDREIYERALTLGHYERYKTDLQTADLLPYAHLPSGGYKYRMHQMSAAVGRVQLRHYDRRHAEILKAMHRFWDLLEGVPGLRAHRPPKGSGSEMGGWYAARGLYVPEELDGLSVTRFCEAVSAEGFPTVTGCNLPLHLHPLLNTADVYGHGRPTRIANAVRDVRQPAGSLPVTEGVGARTYLIPWFKHDRPAVIEEYAAAFRKVAEGYRELKKDDPGNPAQLGGWHFFARR